MVYLSPDQLETAYNVLKLEITRCQKVSVYLLLVKLIDFRQIAKEYFLLVFQRWWDQIDQLGVIQCSGISLHKNKHDKQNHSQIFQHCTTDV